MMFCYQLSILLRLKNTSVTLDGSRLYLLAVAVDCRMIINNYCIPIVYYLLTIFTVLVLCDFKFQALQDFRLFSSFKKLIVPSQFQ